MASDTACEEFVAWALTDLAYKPPEAHAEFIGTYLRRAFELGAASTREKPAATDAMGNPVPESSL